ncbi:MAG TPA: sugar MFS transporter [Povalibacter sp.]|jgi:FHS family L-fucose permease-like MFS transporter|nr:sugar MFS transporter [Povalibacter sp.]
MELKAQATPAHAAANGENNYMPALVVLTSLFFMWGLITSLNDILIPHLKAIFTLSYFQASLVQFCFFGAYAISSLPSGYLVEHIGYKRGIIIGLCVAAIGCIGFYPAAALQSYPLFLFAFFVLASGITLLQVAANPYVAILGKPETAASRLTLTQAFNSAGTAIGPYVGSILILSGAAVGADQVIDKVKEIQTVQGPYLALAAVLFLIAIIIGMFRLPVIQGTTATTAEKQSSGRSLWQYSHLVLGAVGIFAYVGGEVTIGTWLVNLLENIAGMDAQTAGKHVALYWFGAMVGRFIGAFVLRIVRPNRVLAFNAAAVIVLLVVAMAVGGKAAMWPLLAIGLFNSIMFPTIFTLAIDKLGKDTGEGSGMLCVAIVGGALIPPLQAAFADHIGILHSFFVPAICYAYIVYYGIKGYVVKTSNV